MTAEDFIRHSRTVRRGRPRRAVMAAYRQVIIGHGVDLLCVWACDEFARYTGGAENAGPENRLRLKQMIIHTSKNKLVCSFSMLYIRLCRLCSHARHLLLVVASNCEVSK